MCRTSTVELASHDPFTMPHNSGHNQLMKRENCRGRLTMLCLHNNAGYISGVHRTCMPFRQRRPASHVTSNSQASIPASSPLHLYFAITRLQHSWSTTHHGPARPHPSTFHTKERNNHHPSVPPPLKHPVPLRHRTFGPTPSTCP